MRYSVAQEETECFFKEQINHIWSSKGVYFKRAAKMLLFGFL